jgi:hypothetical protein
MRFSRGRQYRINARTTMDLTKVLQQLHEELQNLNAAIVSLERLQEGTRRRGRPAEMLADLGLPARGRPRKKEAARAEKK